MTVQAQKNTLPAPPLVDLPVLKILRLLRSFHTGSVTMREKFGPVCTVRVGPRRFIPTVVFVSSPQGAHDVLSGHDDTFDKGMIMHVETTLLGESLFTLPLEPWKPRKRALQPVFTKKHVEAFTGHMASVAGAEAATWRDGTTVDLNESMRHLTLDVLGRSVFGVQLGDDAGKLSRSLPRTQRYVTRRSTQPFRLPWGVPTPARARFRHHLQVQQRIVEAAIERYFSDPESSTAELIRSLAHAQDLETGQPLTREAMRDELITFMMAGHDTTATTLTYSLWQLGRDPVLQERVAAEVAALGDRPLTPSDVERLPLTVRVLHESLRLCPPGAALGRLATRDAEIDGYAVPRGANIVVSMFALHRAAELWDDALTFDPDRFLPERSQGRSRWAYFPFGAGPRSCIGDHFAMLEATIGLATIVRTVRVQSLNHTFDMDVPFTLTAKGKVPVRVTQR